MIDNGIQQTLVIPGVFDGLAGVQGNRVAFLPRNAGRRIAATERAMLGEQFVILTLVSRPTARDPFASFTFRSLE